MQTFYQLICGPVNQTLKSSLIRNYIEFGATTISPNKYLQKVFVVFVHKKSNDNGNAFLIFTNAIDDKHSTIIF